MFQPKKVKNISKDAFGSQLAQVHIPRQDLSKLTTRKMKGLKKSMAERKVERARIVRERRGGNAEGGDAPSTSTTPSATTTVSTRSSSAGAFLSTSRGPKSKLESIVSSPATTPGKRQRKSGGSGMQLHLSG